MATTTDIGLMAHLMRRAGFGASREELERRAEIGYEATVEEFLHPENQPPFDDDLLFRYIPYLRMGTGMPSHQGYWMYRMITTQRPLEEKMTLFWHQVFATGYPKLNRNPQMNKQLNLFRRLAFGNFRTILIELSRDPAMIFWLDNNENRKGIPNENYGRELLELFSMGVGMDDHFNYTEEDVKDCARAFTGWTIAPQLPRYPYGDYLWDFEYRADEHDDSEKSFLGQHGCFNGEDIIDIIVRQPATARFLCRHLYNFFVADEPQVPSWQTTPPSDPSAIEAMVQAYFDSNYELESVLRVLFNSAFFKNARNTKVKSPAELVASVMRLVDDYTSPKPNIHNIADACGYMGQDLFNPPTVEGWHTGKEWIDSGALVERINFAADKVGNLENPGVRRICDRLASSGGPFTPEQLVEHCAELAGPVQMKDNSRKELITYLARDGEIKCATEADRSDFNQRVAGLLQMIVSLREYQFS